MLSVQSVITSRGAHPSEIFVGNLNFLTDHLINNAEKIYQIIAENIYQIKADDGKKNFQLKIHAT